MNSATLPSFLNLLNPILLPAIIFSPTDDFDKILVTCPSGAMTSQPLSLNLLNHHIRSLALLQTYYSLKLQTFDYLIFLTRDL